MDRRQYESAGEDALLEWAKSGDDRAFGVLVTRHRAQLTAVCYRITGHPQDAEDALQAALLAAWRAMQGFEGRARFSTWLYRIAHHAALAVACKRRPTPFDIDQFEVAVDAPFPEQIATRDDVTKALAKLPPDFRAALVLREYAGLSYDEIAEVQGIRIETVKTRIARARQGMALLLA
jgi:RNA polymerase sigma-70 factor (ECF subfamily)